MGKRDGSNRFLRASRGGGGKGAGDKNLPTKAQIAAAHANLIKAIRSPGGPDYVAGVQRGVARKLAQKMQLKEFYGLEKAREKHAEHRTVVQEDVCPHSETFLNLAHMIDPAFEPDYIRLINGKFTFDEYLAFLKNARDFAEEIRALAKAQGKPIDELFTPGIAALFTEEAHERRVDEMKNFLFHNFHPDLLIHAELKGFFKPAERVAFLGAYIMQDAYARMAEEGYPHETIEEFHRTILKHLATGFLSLHEVDYLNSRISWKRLAWASAELYVDEPVHIKSEAKLKLSSLYENLVALAEKRKKKRPYRTSPRGVYFILNASATGL